jgi:hypothetical protein
VNTNNKIYITCNNTAPTDPDIEPSCCEEDKCIKIQGETKTLCCPNSTDELCNINKTTEPPNYICCPPSQCAAPQQNSYGICCPVGTRRCSHPAVYDQNGNLQYPEIVECCNTSLFVCSDNTDPENPSTYCCPWYRYVKELVINNGQLDRTGISVCCNSTQIVYDNFGRPIYCCPDGYKPNPFSSDPPCIPNPGGGGGGTGPGP